MIVIKIFCYILISVCKGIVKRFRIDTHISAIEMIKLLYYEKEFVISNLMHSSSPKNARSEKHKFVTLKN